MEWRRGLSQEIIGGSSNCAMRTEKKGEYERCWEARVCEMWLAVEGEGRRNHPESSMSNIHYLYSSFSFNIYLCFSFIYSTKNDHLGCVLISACLIGKFRIISLGRKKAQTKYFIISIINAKKWIQTKCGFSKLYIHKYHFFTITFDFFFHIKPPMILLHPIFLYTFKKKCLLDLQHVLLKQG